jgi:hypothetical protein
VAAPPADKLTIRSIGPTFAHRTVKSVRDLTPVGLVGDPEQPDEHPCVQIATEEYEQKKIRDPTGLVVSQVPHNEELGQYEC